MYLITFVVLPKGFKFALKILSIPENEAITVLTTNCANESFDERRRRRRLRHTLDLMDLGYPTFGMPSVVKKCWFRLSELKYLGLVLVEHSTQGCAINFPQP